MSLGNIHEHRTLALEWYHYLFTVISDAELILPPDVRGPWSAQFPLSMASHAECSTYSPSS